MVLSSATAGERLAPATIAKAVKSKVIRIMDALRARSRAQEARANPALVGLSDGRKRCSTGPGGGLRPAGISLLSKIAGQGLRSKATVWLIAPAGWRSTANCPSHR